MYLEIHGLDSANFVSAPGLARQTATLKKTKVKLDLVICIDIL